ncbi:hypothetical protein [Kitasatospora viridis]|uniref:Uncharacterized protein n=1 Tax=Kitasatospora viridis TaxID=281105 RepID=A0A561SAA6_9ACTN|nr:hypothetical protein [Kitasatospora viridis]TWF71777.1 hypothetical protein FHX73_18148 [Kitasatospora viridis]
MSEPITLAELATKWTSRTRSWTSDACTPEVDLLREGSERPTISLGDHTIPLSEHGTDQLCAFYKIPKAFFHRLTRHEQHTLLNSRIHNTLGEVTITYTDKGGLAEVLRPAQPRLAPEQFVQAALAVLPPDSVVIDSWSTTADLRLDVLQPHSATPGPDGHHISAGLRLGQNRAQNLAPWAAPLLHHSNGTVLQIPDPALKIEARGASGDTLAELLAADAQRALARTENDQFALLDLARQSIAGDRITLLNRIAAEQKIPARSMAGISTHLSRLTAPSKYDLVLAIADAANAANLIGTNHRGVRTRLQTIGGQLVAHHAERCSHCHAALAA